jgi:hypothetical protein
MYPQWRSLEDYQAMRGRSGNSLARALEIATFEPGMYEVMETFTPASDQKNANENEQAIVRLRRPELPARRRLNRYLLSASGAV